MGIAAWCGSPGERLLTPDDHDATSVSPCCLAGRLGDRTARLTASEAVRVHKCV